MALKITAHEIAALPNIQPNSAPLPAHMSAAAHPLCPLQPLDALDSETFPGIDERLHLILPVFFAKVGLPKLVHKTEMDNGWIRESLGRAPYRWEWKGVRIYT